MIRAAAMIIAGMYVAPYLRLKGIVPPSSDRNERRSSMRAHALCAIAPVEPLTIND
jgi:hypothetical protein